MEKSQQLSDAIWLLIEPAMNEAFDQGKNDDFTLNPHTLVKLKLDIERLVSDDALDTFTANLERGMSFITEEHGQTVYNHISAGGMVAAQKRYTIGKEEKDGQGSKDGT